MDEKEQKIIDENYELTNKYIAMDTLPKEFILGVCLMARDLSIEAAKAKLIRTKEYAEYIKDKANLMRLTQDLEEALEYWNKRNAKKKD